MSSLVLLFPSSLVLLPICWWLYQEHQITIGITGTFMLHIFFSIPYQYLSAYSSFSISFSSTLWSAGKAKLRILQVLFFFFFFFRLLLSLTVWSRFVDTFVSQNLSRVFAFYSQGQIMVVYIPFVRMVKFKFLAQFPVDYLSHSVVSSLIHFLRKFAYNVIDHFVSTTTLPSSAGLLRPISSCFDMVGPYSVVLCSYWERFGFSLKISLS